MALAGRLTRFYPPRTAVFSSRQRAAGDVRIVHAARWVSLTVHVRPFALALLIPASFASATVATGARWWDLGHRLVARLAESRLTPRTREAVRDILGGQSLADASVWADNIRQYRHDADKLHYVNIPLGDDRYMPARHCPGGHCIIAAIEQERPLLA